MLQNDTQPPVQWALLVAQLLADLSAIPSQPDLTNPYAVDGTPGTAQRRANLQLALTLAYEHGPTILLVGEAPGYLGARRTGVPFTSERILLAGVEPPGIFGAARGFARATADGKVSSEQTATLVWRQASRHALFLVGWNALPLHPHRPDNPQSNRPPRVHEIALGLPFLQRIRDLFPNLPVVAMGNVAAHALTRLHIPHQKVRHPAQGGARLFAEGISQVAATIA